MKIALITDTHWGIRSDNLIIHEYQKKFLNEVFFPYLERHKIQRCVHLGDLVDRKKYINFYTEYRMRVDFLEQLRDRKILFDLLIGNHDTFYKDTNSISIGDMVRYVYPEANIFIEPAEVTIDGCDILMVPWIAPDILDRSLSAIKKSKSQICFGHFEFSDFPMDKLGATNPEGLSPDIVKKFDVVLTGHYHHKSHDKNIHYLGSPMQFTWVDYNDPRGFHIFDTDTRELEFVRNPFDNFKKIFYTDTDKTLDEILDSVKFSSYEDCFVKVIVKEKNNPYWFDLFMEKLNKVSMADLQIVEDHYNLDIQNEEEIFSEAEDTLTIFKSYIDQIDDKNLDKSGLQNLLSGLYNEAVEVE